MSAVLQAQEPRAKDLTAVQSPLVQHFDLLATAPGGVQRLRELILTLAVQGKLVPQDPNDEPARVLLQKVGAEKERLLAEGKIKRESPLPAITEEDCPFGIPTSWRWARLGSITNYGAPRKASQIGPETWVLDLEDIEKSTGRLLQRLRFKNRPALSDKNEFIAGDVLYGKLRPYLNKVLVADEAGVCTTEIIPFRCYGECVPEYFKVALGNPYFLSYVNAMSYGMKMPRLGTDDARNAVIPTPPLAEQSRIVARVEELMRVCDALDAKVQLETAQHAQLVSTLLGTLTSSATPEELAENWERVATHFDILLDRPEAVDALEQTILQLAVRGLLVPQDPNDDPASVLLQKIRAEKDRLIAEGKIKRDKPVLPIDEAKHPFDLPAGWKWVRLDTISEFTNGHAFPSSKFSLDSTGVGVIKIGDIQNGVVSTANMSYVSQQYASSLDESFRVAPGDMLIAMSGATTGKLGFNRQSQFFLLNQRVGKISLHFVHQAFAHHFLSTKIAENLSISAGSAIPNLSTTQIMEIAFPLPPLAEQSRIVARVEELRGLCTALRQRLADCRTAQAHLAETLVETVAT